VDELSTRVNAPSTIAGLIPPTDPVLLLFCFSLSPGVSLHPVFCFLVLKSQDDHQCLYKEPLTAGCVKSVWILQKKFSGMMVPGSTTSPKPFAASQLYFYNGNTPNTPPDLFLTGIGVNGSWIVILKISFGRSSINRKAIQTTGYGFGKQGHRHFTGTERSNQL
jgi:hypothetical protein